MTTAQIIADFETYVDDTTELSTTQEIALVNKHYQIVCDDRPWEFLKKEGSGTMLSTTTITTPSDFAHFVENLNLTDNSQNYDFNAKPVGIFINDNKILRIVNWDTRRQYANQDGYAYLDMNAGLIRTTYAQPAGATYSFDYKSVPATLLIGSTPVIPERFHPMIYHSMAVDDMIIQLFDKARSYANENRLAYAGYLSRMAYWNANLRND